MLTGKKFKIMNSRMDGLYEVRFPSEVIAVPEKNLIINCCGHVYSNDFEYTCMRTLREYNFRKETPRPDTLEKKVEYKKGIEAIRNDPTLYADVQLDECKIEEILDLYDKIHSIRTLPGYVPDLQKKLKELVMALF